MRVALVLISGFGHLVTLASNVERALERDLYDGPVAPTPDSCGGGTILYEQSLQLGSVPVNRTEGSTRSGKREFNNLLEGRQSNVCSNPGYILVCPITDPLPCCAPNFPVCCHTSTCCPIGTFCVGQSTCCLTGTTACGEGCCASGTTCCGTACCSAGFTCVSTGVCQNLSATSSSLAVSSAKNYPTTITEPNSNDQTTSATASQVDSANDSNNTNSSNNSAVIGGAVGGVLGGLVLIGGVIAAFYFYNKSRRETKANTATTRPQGHGWSTGGSLGSPSIGHPQMTSTSMPFTPTAAAAGAGAGFAAHQAYGAPGSPYQQPSTPSNATDYNQPPVNQYPYGAYGAAAPPGGPPGSAPWAGGQAYGQPGGFVVPGTPGPRSHPSHYAGAPTPSNVGVSVYGGMVPEPMQPGQSAYGGFDASVAYPQPPSPTGPQVQT